MKKYVAIFLVAAIGAITGVSVQKYFSKDRYWSPLEVSRAQLISMNGSAALAYPDFIGASALALPAVVHVKSYFPSQASSSAKPSNPWFPDFFGSPQLEKQAAGSGVIISADGYISTNYHVVKDAERVEITMYDNHTYPATVVGKDPSTDLALLKIEEQRLPFLSFGNSDQISVGEWVLAVGNPFNLTSTVTAGIVSAKGRSLNILAGDYRIESFIQTDAAVNPGNSGGALINAKGEVIGINTAIASETGRYEGYSFAIPANLVNKVMEDLKKHGKVKRGIIGINIRDIDANLAEARGLGVHQGVYVNGIIPGGAAEEAGIQTGDVVVMVNEIAVKNTSELQEIIGQFRPGDNVQVRVLRNGEEKQISVVLKEIASTQAPEIAESKPENFKGFSSELGADLSPLTALEKTKLGIKYGLKVTEVREGLLREIGVEKGFIITKVNRKAVDESVTAEEILKDSKSAVLIEGVHPDGSRGFYSFSR